MRYPSQAKGDNDHDPDVALDVKPSQNILNSWNETILNFDRPSFINVTPMMATNKARNPKIQRLAEIDVLFPKIKFLKASFDMPYDPNRFLDFSYSVFFFYFVSCLKFFMVKEFEIATFCDIQRWEIFDKKVSENEIEMMQTLNCSEKCNDNANIVLTKVFESNYYFFYSINVLQFETEVQRSFVNIFDSFPLFEPFNWTCLIFLEQIFRIYDQKLPLCIGSADYDENIFRLFENVFSSFPFYRFFFRH